MHRKSKTETEKSKILSDFGKFQSNANIYKKSPVKANYTDVFCATVTIFSFNFKNGEISLKL